MTPHSFAVRYLPGERHVLADGGILATCPACKTPSALRVEADSAGGYVACFSGVNAESPCAAIDFAAALSMPLEDFEAAVAAIRPDGFVEAAPSRPSLRGLAIGRKALGDLPTLEPLIEDTILRRTVNFIAGPPASGKSFHLLAWAASIATGTPWMGRNVSRGRVLYLIAEGAYGVHDRLLAWESFHDKEIPDEGLVSLPFAVQLTDKAALGELVDFVREEDFDLVIVDTLSRSAVGLDENSQADMSRFIGAVDSIRDGMTNGSVVVAHHSSKSGSGLRGSSVIEGAADVVYATRKGAGDDAHLFYLDRAKNKYGPEADFLTFERREEGPSVVLVKPALADRSEPKRDRFASAATWRVLLNGFAHGQTFTRSEAKRLLAERSDVSQSTFYNHWTDLLGRGALALFASESGRATDYYRLDLEAAAALGFETERFNPLGGYSGDFLDPAPVH